MNTKLVKLYGVFGIVTSPIGFLMLSLSIMASPWFELTQYALSDLGAEGFGSVIFNGGLTMTGAFMMLFSLGLVELTRSSTIGKLGAYLHLAASWLLVGIGVANINVTPWHWYFSVSFFVTLPISLLTFTIYFIRKGLKYHALLSGLVSLTSASVWMVDWPSAAIPELIAVGSVSVWQIVMGLWMRQYVGEGDEGV